jgi:hypothetical protein
VKGIPNILKGIIVNFVNFVVRQVHERDAGYVGKRVLADSPQPRIDNPELFKARWKILKVALGNLLIG